jgi:hypothetical protein
MVAGALLAGCGAELGEPDPAPLLDPEAFRCRVQPVIAARCAFAECHASALRPYRLYAVGRMRLAVGWDRLEEPLTPAELAANYEVSRNFAAGTTPLLTAKPLDSRAGGYYHRGADLYGEDDVFLTTDDPGYQVLADWIAGGTAASSCTPITEVGP